MRSGPAWAAVLVVLATACRGHWSAWEPGSTIHISPFEPRLVAALR